MERQSYFISHKLLAQVSFFTSTSPKYTQEDKRRHLGKLKAEIIQNKISHYRRKLIGSTISTGILRTELLSAIP
jgi:hypothetical protein